MGEYGENTDEWIAQFVKALEKEQLLSDGLSRPRQISLVIFEKPPVSIH